MLRAFIAVFVAAATIGYAFRPELAASSAFWISLTIPHALLSALAVYRMFDEGTLGDRLRLRAGDVTLGAVLAAVLLGGAWVVRRVFFPADSDGSAWLFRIALQVGMPGSSARLALLFVSMAFMEELIWRGMVLDAFAERLGSSRAWLPATLAYAVAHTPSLWTLSDGVAGPNPVLVFVALGGGAVWSLAASRLGRLPPVIVSHAVFGVFAPALLLPSLSP